MTPAERAAVADLMAPPPGESFQRRPPIERLFSRKQLASIILSRTAKIALWSGAVSAGKTVTSLLEFLLAVKKAPKTGIVVVIANTLQSVWANVFQVLQNEELYGVLAREVAYAKGSGRAIVLGREVLIYTANNERAADRIKGSTVALAYVDEATLVPETFWDMLVTRLRVAGARLLATTNPGSRNHWLRLRWILKAKAVDLIHFRFTMDDNPVFDEGGAVGPAYKERMRASFAGIFFERNILGRWTNAEGAIFPMFDPKRHVIPWSKLPRIRQTFAVGVDFGITNATVGILFGLTDEADPGTGKWAPRLVLFDEWRHDSRETGERLAPSELAAQFKTWLRATDHVPAGVAPAPAFVFLDPSAAPLSTELGRDRPGVNGKRMPTFAADNAVTAGIADIANLLQQGRLVIAQDDRVDALGHPLPVRRGCDGWLSEVTEYVWDQKRAALGEDAPVKDADHSLDAARYAIHSTVNTWEPILRRAYGLAA